jgi:hypothetical protein
MSIDNVKLTKQKEFLRKEILEGTNKDKFKVINLECGTGKSKTAREVFKTIGSDDRHILYVVQRNVDAIECEKACGSNVKAINTDTFDLKEFNLIKKDLKNIPVIVISHEKYKVLAKDKSQRKYFTEGRDTLIIDEYLDVVNGNTLSISMEDIEKTRKGLNSRALENLFMSFTNPIFDFLNDNSKRNTFWNFKGNKKEINKKINNFKAKVKCLKDNELNSYIEKVKQFYNQTCVVEHKVMYCTDRSYDYWFMNNNIVLDATATVNMAYTLREDMFTIAKQSRVSNHDKWNFHSITSNVTVSGKAKAVDFYDIINGFLKQKEEAGVPILYVGSIEDEKHIQNKHINHFGAITGSNEYKDLHDIVIGHTPNMPYRQYVLEYLFYSNEKFDGRNEWGGANDGNKEKKVFRFKNKRFEDYRVNKVTEHIYQAIKRINRNMIDEANVLLFCNDEKVIKKLNKLFGKEFVVLPNILKYESKRSANSDLALDKINSEKKANSYGAKFITLCDEILEGKHNELLKTKKDRYGKVVVVEGKYSKKLISQYLGIDTKHFKEYILDAIEVFEYMSKKGIKNEGQAIVF